MELMEVRRRVMSAMASVTNVKTGTFEGNGTKTVTIPCDFYPDVILVELVDAASRPVEYQGPVYEMLWRDVISADWYDMQSANNNKNAYAYAKDTGMADYNYPDPGARGLYALVDGSNVTLDHNTDFNEFGIYKNGYTYSYVFIKYTE